MSLPKLDSLSSILPKKPTTAPDQTPSSRSPRPSNLALALAPVPVPVPTQASSSSSSKNTLPARPTFALPARPTFDPKDSLLLRIGQRRSVSPPAVASRQESDVYIAPQSPRRTDVYIPSPSPPPPPPRYRKRYRSPSPDRRRSFARPRTRTRSPSPYRRTPSPYYRRSRSPSPRRYRRTPTPPPPPPRRSLSRSPSRTRLRSRSPTKSRARTLTRSVSPIKAERNDDPLPKNFLTFAAQKEKKRDEYHAKKAAEAQRRSEEQEQRRAEYQKREQEKLAAQQSSQDGHRPRQAVTPRSRPIQLTISPAKLIPTGPRGQSSFAPLTSTRPSIPIGPRADRPIPLGPRAELVSAAYSTSSLGTAEQPQHTPLPLNLLSPKTDKRSGSLSPRRSSSPKRSPETQDDDVHQDMPPRHRGNGHGGHAPPRSSTSVQLPGPMWTEEQIMAEHGAGVLLKPQWAANPKSPLANYLGGTGGASDTGYKAQQGILGGKKISRVTVVADAAQNIVGVGDHAQIKEAEKLAALSAVLQLAKAGLLEGGKPAKSALAANGPSISAAMAAETAKLSDGSIITYDRARQFMDYYCRRYKFGKPDIEFSQSQSKSRKGKHASQGSWDAVMTVGGRRIGMGTAASKKSAQAKCYLDVAQYLESCDPALWSDFVDSSKGDHSADLGMAPRLVFQMSDELNEDIQGLCRDIRQSQLYNKAPVSGVNDEQHMPTWGSGRSTAMSEAELEKKSLALQDKLASYQSDPKMDKMRAQRASLPVTSRATEIIARIEVNDVTIVMAATGSGKTTQIPQLLFDDFINRGQGAKCNILCTQPRRLAAMSVAERIADERGDYLGGEVGYQVRFDAKPPTPNGSITFCTTGIFLKRMQSALGQSADATSVAEMDKITHIVVDEVHERDIDTDLSLVVLKRLLANRKARGVPLKVVLMSATIDPTLFQNYFKDDRGRPAPIAEVPGRTFPVQRHYLDDIVPEVQHGLTAQNGGWIFREKNVNEYLNKELSKDRSLFGPNTGMELEIPYPLVALTVAYVMKQSDDGHVLVFLPGWDEIKKVADILLDSRNGNLLGQRFSDASKYSLHYLHSSIPAAEQKEVFRPPPKGVRRIILATNIAETSVTIPDVVYVVDTARVKEKRYDPDRHMSSLVSAWVGSSNLNQRAGRAGRHREGEYFGLLSKNRLESLDAHQMVEMKREDLSNVVMHVKALNLGEVEHVLAATIEPPEPSRIDAAVRTLEMLGAMDSAQNLTSLGRVLLQIPVDAAIGKLCLYGSFFRCLDSALTLAAVLTNRDPFLSPPLKKDEADAVKDSWSPLAFRSDPLAIVAAFNAWSAMDDRGDYSQATRFCGDNFLSKPTMLQIKQVKKSLLQSLEQAGVVAVSAGGQVRHIGRRGVVPPELNEHGGSLPLLAALIAMASAPNFALRTSEKTCRTAQDKTVFIHSASVNSRRREAGGPIDPSASFNPLEKRLYAFGEKTRNVPLGGNPNSGITNLRVVTRLDPMTYMLFGAYRLDVTQRGLEADGWLPITGNLEALDDIQRLKTLVERCMLRVFEGVGKSLTRGRDERRGQAARRVQVRQGASRIQAADEDVVEEGEQEGEGEDEDDGPGQKRVIEPLSRDEIKELELLTTDIVRVLDAYASERDQGGSTLNSRPATPGLQGGW